MEVENAGQVEDMDLQICNTSNTPRLRVLAPWSSMCKKGNTAVHLWKLNKPGVYKWSRQIGAMKKTHHWWQCVAYAGICTFIASLLSNIKSNAYDTEKLCATVVVLPSEAWKT